MSKKDEKKTMMKLSEETFNKIWDNKEDAIYDEQEEIKAGKGKVLRSLKDLK